jgi:modulator of FtsH protease HflK
MAQQHNRPGSGGDGGDPIDLRAMMGGQPPPKYVIPVAIIIILLVWAAFTSVYTVQPEQRAVIKRFGQVVGISDPGLHFKLPFGIDDVQFVATERVLKQEFGFRAEGARATGRTAYEAAAYEDESLMLTGDLNIIDVEWVVQYRINDPIRFLYEIREPTRTLRDISESVMRRVVGNRLGSEVLTVGRVEIQQQSREEIQQIMDRYNAGIHVITVELQDVVPPPAVQPAFNEVNEARQERERMINEAQKRVNQEIPRAEGEALRTVAEAQGYATERVNRAMGESVRFSAVLTEYRQAPQVTRSRLYLEALSEVLPDIGQVLVVQDGQVGPLPLLEMNGGQRRQAAGTGPNRGEGAGQGPAVQRQAGQSVTDQIPAGQRREPR